MPPFVPESANINLRYSLGPFIGNAEIINQNFMLPFEKPGKKAMSASLHSSFNNKHIGWLLWHRHTYPGMPAHTVSISLALSHAHCLAPLFLPLFLLRLTLTVILLWIEVIGSAEVRLTSNPDFLLSQHFIKVKKTQFLNPHLAVPLTALKWAEAQY